MATSKEEIRGWLNEAKEAKAAFLVVVCDTYDWEDYPVQVGADASYTDVHKAIEHFHGPNMQKVMEVYDLSKDIEVQLKMHRAGQEYIR